MPGRPPQRSCVACRTVSDKRELVRVVRLPAGQASLPAGAVEVDLTGKKAGRGAYICRRAACWQQALVKGRLEAALKTKLSADDKLRLHEFAATIEPVAV